MRTRLAAFVFVLGLSYAVFAQNIPPYYGWVNDFASVISPEIERDMTEKIQKYNNATGIEIAVVTVQSLQNYSVEEFSEKLFATWGVGQKGKDNGVLLLIAPSQHERDLRIEVGYGLEGDLTDSQSGEILDECVVPHTRGRNDGWARGANSGLDCLIAHLGTKSFQVRLEERRRSSEMSWFIFKAIAIMIVVTVSFIAIGLALRKRKRRKGVQRENDTKLTELRDKGEDLIARVAEAETVLEQVRLTYSHSSIADFGILLDDTKDNATTITSQTIPGLWEFHANLKHADSVSRRISQVEKDITAARTDALKIISLPALIEEEKKYVEENESSVTDEAGTLQSLAEDGAQFTREINAELSDIQAKIAKGLAFVIENKSNTTGASPDWLTLADNLEQVSQLIAEGNELITNYFQKVKEAKTQESTLREGLRAKVASVDAVMKLPDVSGKRRAEYTAKKGAIASLLEREPRNDPEWFVFINEIRATNSELDIITKAAQQDIASAEDARKPRPAPRSRTSTYGTSGSSGGGFRSSSRPRSGGSSFGGFGGGRSGGGGVSRKG